MRRAAIFASAVILLTACSPDGPISGAQTSGREPKTGQEISGLPSGGAEPLVDPGEITSVLGPDQIPAIDRPKFVAPGEVDFVHPQEPVLAVELDGKAKAYPLSIMTWHEIVNDRLGGMPVAVTYCPLCNTGIAFQRPTIDGDLLDFGTSGKLHNSNLLMYDRQTETLWAQATGQAVVGPLTGLQLEFVAAQILSFADWSAANPDGLVLSTDTGTTRSYGQNPYVGYDSGDDPFLFSGEADERLPALERVLGYRGDGQIVAFPYSALRELAEGGWAAVNAVVGEIELAVFWKRGTTSALDAAAIAGSRDVGATGAFLREIHGRRLTFEATEDGIVDRETGTAWTIAGRGVDGRLAGERLTAAVAIESFWFDWAAFHPETEVFGQGGTTDRRGNYGWG